MSITAVSTITAADWSRQIGTYGAVVTNLDDIDQAMRIILSTPKGAVPHRPTFGCDAWRYLDYPVSVSVAHIVREATDALRDWEPRAQVTAITPAIQYSTVSLSIAWKVVLGTATSVTEASYALSQSQ